MKNEEKELSNVEKLLIRIKLEKTHRYWTVLIISKIDNPSEREIKLESHDYTLPNIEYKDREWIKGLVIREFNQKMREKYKHRPGYRVSPILIGNLCLTREEAEESMDKMKKADEFASRYPPKKD